MGVGLRWPVPAEKLLEPSPTLIFHFSQSDEITLNNGTESNQ
jgi:hypothetical protein